MTALFFAAFAACDQQSAAPPPVQTPGAGAAGALAPASTPVPAATPSATPVTSGSPAATSGTTPTAAAPAAPQAPAASAAPAAPATPAGTAAPLKVSISVPNVAPGQEGTECVQVKLSNAAPVDIIQLHNRLSAASHHFIVTALTDLSASEKPLEACSPFRGALAGAPLAITQKHDDLVLLPQGVGYHFNAGQVLHLELHYLNASDKPVNVTGEAELFPAEANAQLQQGAVLLVGTTDINIPAHATHQNNPKFLALPKGMEGTEFYAITGHTHRLGTSVQVSSASAPTVAGAQLYAPPNFNWEAPEMKQLSPHVNVPAGGGFMLQCGWNNTTDTAVSFGESALAEMCFFWAYYYPRRDVVSIVLDNLDPSIIKKL
jgi:hypothetical protein